MVGEQLTETIQASYSRTTLAILNKIQIYKIKPENELDIGRIINNQGRNCLLLYRFSIYRMLTLFQAY